MFQRSCIQIPAPYTGWTFFHIHICCKICNVCFKRQKKMRKRPGLANLKNYLLCVVYRVDECGSKPPSACVFGTKDSRLKCVVSARYLFF